METKKSNDFIAQGSILAIASILVRIIGMIYRIPMTGIIGDEGNSLYSYAYSIYTILLLLSSYSLPLAVSKMVSARAETGEWRNVRRIFQCALLFGLVVGTVFALLVLLGARFFTTVLYHDDLAAIALRLMAPTILVMSLLGVFRGFFQGLHTTTPTALSQLLEQLVNAVISVLCAWLLFHFGARQDDLRGTQGLAAAWGAAGGTIGTGAGALTALLFFFVLYLRFRKSFSRMVKQDVSGKVEEYADIFRLLIRIAAPVILSTAVYNLIDLIDGSLFSYYMASAGAAELERKRIWGAYSGKCLLMIHIPVSISSAMGVSLVPSLTAAWFTGKKRVAVARIQAILKFTGTVAFPSCVGLCVLAEPIIRTLFPSDNSRASAYLMLGSIAVVMFSFSTITNSILQGIDRMSVPVLHSCISLILHVAVCAVLMWGFHTGIYGIIIGYIFFGLCMSVLNFISLRRILGYRPDLGRIVIMPLICSAVMGLICFGIYRLFHLFAGTALPMLLAVLAGIAVYFVLILKTGLLNEKDLKDLPGGRKLAILAKRLKLIA